MSQQMKELMEFPVIYTFKAMGENCSEFIDGVRQIFECKNIESFDHKPSSKGNYVSVSVTVEVSDFNELETFYTSIKQTRGLKFHL